MRHFANHGPAPTPTERLWVIAYDVTCPKRLYQVARLLEHHGKRVQHSVFECWLTPWRYAQLRTALCRAIDPAQDNLRCYPQSTTRPAPITPTTPQGPCYGHYFLI